MPSDGVQKLDQKTNLHQNGMPTVCVRIFSQKDRNAVQQSFQGVLYRNVIINYWKKTTVFLDEITNMYKYVQPGNPNLQSVSIYIYISIYIFIYLFIYLCIYLFIYIYTYIYIYIHRYTPGYAICLFGKNMWGEKGGLFRTQMAYDRRSVDAIKLWPPIIMQREEVNSLFTSLCIQRWKNKKPYALP